MKKVLFILLAFLVGINLIGCKKDKHKNSEPTYQDTISVSDTIADQPFIVEEEVEDTVPIYKEDTTGKLTEVKDEEIKPEQKIYVIVGSFKNENNAKKKLDNLKKLGYDAQILPKFGEYHRVAVAGYDTEKEAREALSQFRKAFSDRSIWLLLR